LRYDLLGRLIEIRGKDGPPALFSYDPAGNVIEESRGAFRAEYTYTVRGLLSEARFQPAGRRVSYGYDSADRRTFMEVEGVGRWSYQYDERNNVVAVEDPSKRTTRFEYDEAGRVVVQILPNGARSSRAYDGRGRWLEVSVERPSGVTLIRRSYAYDQAGNLIRETREDGTVATYQYDDLNRIRGASAGAYEERFDYDAAGNLLPKGGAEYDATQQVERFEELTFTHDELGRIVERRNGDSRLQYVYGSSGQLEEVRRQTAGSNASVVAAYDYDAKGKRTRKTSGGRTTYYVYAGGEVLLELDEGFRAERVWTPSFELDRPIQYEEGGEAFYPVADPFGTVIALLDEKGDIAGRWSYEPFGELVETEGRGESALPGAKGFAGRDFDSETGLYYFRARYYDPSLGRFTTPDPISGRLSEPASFHPYQFAFNNPLKFSDPSGMIPTGSDIADAAQRAAPGVGEKAGRAVTGGILFGLSILPRVVNAFRGEAGRESNRWMDQKINSAAETGATIGDGLASTATELVTDPLRVGQASGEYVASTSDVGRKGTWGQAGLTALTEIGRGASLAPLARPIATVAVKGTTRAATGAIARFGKSQQGSRGQPGSYMQNPARWFDDLGPKANQVGGWRPPDPSKLDEFGRVFVNEAWDPKWFPQLFAHEGIHSAISNIASIFGNTGRAIRSATADWRIFKIPEEIAAFVTQVLHAQSHGGPLGNVLSKGGKILPGYPQSLSGIVKHVFSDPKYGNLGPLIGDLAALPPWVLEGIAQWTGPIGRTLQPWMPEVRKAAAQGEERERLSRTPIPSELDVDKVIAALTGNSKPCKEELVRGEHDLVRALVEDANSFSGTFELLSNAFFKEASDQTSICENKNLSRWLWDAEPTLAEVERILGEMRTTRTDLLLREVICPDPARRARLRILTNQIPEIEANIKKMKRRLADMRREFARENCDEKEKEEESVERSEGPKDPRVTLAGAEGEICGDGKDNDGDGFIDEDCGVNANIRVFLYDSGPAKDDIFELLFRGGSLGATATGRGRSFSLSLSPGDYEVVVRVIDDGGNIGTFTCTVFENERVIASQAGEPTAGGTVAVPFRVGAATPAVVAPFDPLRVTSPNEKGARAMKNLRDRVECAAAVRPEGHRHSRRHFRRLVVAIAWGWALPLAAGAADVERVAVLEFVRDGVEPSTAEFLGEFLNQELSSSREIEVMALDAVRSRLHGARIGDSGCFESACAREARTSPGSGSGHRGAREPDLERASSRARSGGGGFRSAGVPEDVFRSQRGRALSSARQRGRRAHELSRGTFGCSAAWRPPHRTLPERSGDSARARDSRAAPGAPPTGGSFPDHPPKGCAQDREERLQALALDRGCGRRCRGRRDLRLGRRRRR
jgi:RHS repeat-associated protein